MRKNGKLIAFFIVVLLGCLSCSVSVKAISTSIEVDQREQILAQAMDEAEKQQMEQEHDFPNRQVQIKILFIALGNVTLQSETSNTQKVITMDDEEQKYARQAANELSQTLNKGVPNVNFQVDFKFLDQNIHYDTKNIGDNTLVHADSSEDFMHFIKENYAFGEYDSIMTVNSITNKGQIGGAASKVSYTGVNGAAYSCGVLNTQNTFTPIYPAILFLHEFCHQMSYTPVKVPKGDVHGAEKYGYAKDEKSEFTSFYLDYLKGNVKDPTDGLYYGIFPKMWQVSPRFVNHPAKVEVQYVDQNGKNLAENEYFFGPGGDPYKTKAASINGYTLDKVQGDSPNGTLETGQIKKINYVYKNVQPKEVTVQYVDEDGNKLAPSETLSGNYKDTYTTTAKEITGWNLIEKPENAVGIFTDAAQTVTYVYEKVKEVLPVEPTQPQDPTTPVKSDPILSTPTDPNQPVLVVTDPKVGVQVIKAEDPASSLPKTGDQTNRSLLGMGGLFLLLVGYLLYRTRREEKRKRTDHE
ncbi:MucBP domain-containing protein [Listeria valentina]|uniref:MucBP domain-containing protein n=1 Tax=Listeria valentina TaxID=2705293 RepID=UPI0014306475|nr:MucBP domain-containing protein [Listeria valentina]